MNVNLVVIIYVFYNTILVDCSKSDIRNHLGTRTPYRYRNNKNDTQIKYAGCHDSDIWMIIRHGTRLPSAKEIIGMKTIMRDLKYQILRSNVRGKGILNLSQIEEFKNWSSNIDVDEEKYLAQEGKDEMISLAEGMQKRFPNAIKNKYSNTTFKFRYTATQRAQQSARYFTIGLFDKKDSQNVIYSPATKIDPVLRFYKHCDKWQKQVKKNPKTYKEQQIFGKSSHMNETLAAVSKRLGLDRLVSLDEANLMFKVCGYETAWDKHRVSPWCYAFDKKDAEALEYYHDLKHYWLDGYGHSLTYKQACLAVKTMFELFSTKTEKAPLATFLFAHSGTLLKILTYMHLYKPGKHLTGDHIDENRQWKTSNIDCFASNLAFVLFKCKDKGDHVLTLHQENIIKLPMCEQELCPLKELEEYFHESIKNCDFSDMCTLDKETEA